jgi:ATP-dependent protease ClpP protease subunit
MIKKQSDIEQLIEDIHQHNINIHSREIFMHSPYTEEDSSIEYRLATTFIKNINILNTLGSGNILVHMHTTGGVLNEGMAIFDAIRLSRSPVTILAYSEASSMSGIVLQAADKRIVMPSCEIMIHHGSIEVNSDSLTAKSTVAINERWCKRMLQIFARRAMKAKYFKDRQHNETKVMEYFDRQIKNTGDWYLSPEQALTYGVCDGILGKNQYKSIESIRIKRKFRGEI